MIQAPTSLVIIVGRVTLLTLTCHFCVHNIYADFLDDINSEKNKVNGQSNQENETGEEEIPLYLINGTALMEELRLINGHVYSLLNYLNDTTRNEESYGMKVVHVVGEMMSLHDSLANLQFSEEHMRQNLRMNNAEVEKARTLYVDSIQRIYEFNKLVGE